MGGTLFFNYFSVVVLAFLAVCFVLAIAKKRSPTDLSFPGGCGGAQVLTAT